MKSWYTHIQNIINMYQKWMHILRLSIDDTSYFPGVLPCQTCFLVIYRLFSNVQCTWLCTRMCLLQQIIKSFIRVQFLHNICKYDIYFFPLSFGWDNKDNNTLWHVLLVDRLGFRRKVGSKGPPGKLHNLSFFSQSPSLRGRNIAVTT